MLNSNDLESVIRQDNNIQEYNIDFSSFYGGRPELHISYISDIHLLHHLKDCATMKSLIYNSVKSLYETMDKDSIIVFAGDISSDKNITVDFFTQFVRYKDFLSYKSTKKKLNNRKYIDKNLDINKVNFEQKIIKLTNYINILKSRLIPYFNFNYIVRYKKRNYQYATWVDTINIYKQLDSYRSKNIPDDYDYCLDILAQKLDLLDALNKKYNQYLSYCKDIKEQNRKIKSIHKKSIKELTIADIYTKHCLLSDDRDIIVVLGNHEYVDFNSIKEAVEYYKQSFDSLGIKLLHNDFFEFNTYNKPCIIFGGTGFAKYNLNYNADTLVCCNNFTRDIEFEETSLFEKAYIKAKETAHINNACFICVSHYPIQDCFSHVDNDTIYFYGHNHRNFYHRNEDSTIYADNQIGCTNPNIVFKNMTTGIEFNPYFTLDDGLYITTVKDYLQFNKYIGEYIGQGELLNKRCKSDGVDLYVIKQKGYYGFFLLNSKPGKSTGISIINGGKTKRITNSIDMQWLLNNFDIVLSKYLQILTPLRITQERLSKELKDLGFLGLIHGCIVDIDSYHHIMLNPFDGSMTYYFSPEYGYITTFPSFDKVLISIQQYAVDILPSKRDYKLIQQKVSKQKENPTYLLGRIDNSYMIESSDCSSNLSNYIQQEVSRSEGMYSVSRRVNALQRLFTGRVLRDFDLTLADSPPIIKHKRIHTNNQANKSTKTKSQTIFNGLKIIKETEGVCECKCGCNTLFSASKEDIINNIVTSCGCGINNYKSYVGCTKMMNCGTNATVIEDFDSNNITVQFADGSIRKHIRKDHFRNGKVKYIDNTNETIKK